MFDLSTSAPIEGAVIPKSLRRDAANLCQGRHDLPLRVMVGRIRSRQIDDVRLLSHADHVAVLGLVSAGMHQHDATILVATGNAGAFEGSIQDFETWRRRKKVKEDHLITTTLPDSTHWVIWSRDRSPKSKLIPMVLGWAGTFVDFDDVVSVNPSDLVTIH